MSSPTMLDAVTRLDLSARRAGPIAMRALREGAAGSVAAVFERSIYVRLGTDLVCIGPPALGNGPLNLVCDGWPANSQLSMRLQTEEAAEVRGHRLLVGRTLAVSLAALEPWGPAASFSWEQAQLARGLAIFRASLPTEIPHDGLAALLVHSADQSTVVAAAQAPAAYLTGWVCKAQQDGAAHIDADPLAPLLGLGPGLTPSGDDYLGGALVALAHLGLTHPRDVLWTALGPFVPTATSDISAAHLAAAAEGFGSAALHELLDAIVTADARVMTERIAAVARIGHTSGWDAMAGAISVLSAVSSVR